MRYALLIYEDDARYADMPEAEHEAILAQYGQLMTDMKAAGVFLGANRLRAASSATALRMRNGRRFVSDGPFAEIKEQLGGLILIDVADLDAALNWAARIPGAQVGTIEVRPVWI